MADLYLTSRSAPSSPVVRDSATSHPSICCLICALVVDLVAHKQECEPLRGAWPCRGSRGTLSLPPCWWWLAISASPRLRVSTRARFPRDRPCVHDCLRSLLLLLLRRRRRQTSLLLASCLIIFLMLTFLCGSSPIIPGVCHPTFAKAVQLPASCPAPLEAVQYDWRSSTYTKRPSPFPVIQSWELDTPSVNRVYLRGTVWGQ